MAEYKLVVLSNAVEGREAEYNDWYDNRHLDDVLRIEGFHRAQRFVNAYAMPGTPPTHTYLAIYEFESDDLDATFERFLAASNTPAMPISEALAGDAMPMVYRVLGPAKARG